MNDTLIKGLHNGRCVGRQADPKDALVKEGSEVLDLELLSVCRDVGGMVVHEKNGQNIQRTFVALVSNRKGKGHSLVFENLTHLQRVVVVEAGEC